MNLRDLKYFLALADKQHFGKAARACFVSQPSLSIQIKKLEEFLGVTLVERSHRSVILTEVGKRIAQEARELIQRESSIIAIAKAAQDPFSGQFNLGVIPTLTAYLFPLLMPELAKTESFPKLSIYLAEHQTKTLLSQLDNGELDAAIISLPIKHRDLHVEVLFKEELMLAVSKKHALAKQKMIKFAQLVDQSLLLLEEGHCLREQTLDICNQVGAIEETNFRASNLEILRHMVASQSGITLMPALARLPHDHIQYLSFSEHKPTRTIAIAWRKSNAKILLLEKMVMHIRRLMNTGA